MKISMAILALVASASAIPQAVTEKIKPEGKPPAGCKANFGSKFEVSIFRVGSNEKRAVPQERQCGGDDVLVMNLKNGILKDNQDRTGYISSSYQFQFDGPPQSGALFTAGFSACGNHSLAFGSTTVFWQCLSGDFYNLYDRDWAEQCEPVELVMMPCGEGSGKSGSNARQKFVGSSIVATTVVTIVSNGETTVVPTTIAVPMCQIGDGQVQVRTTPCDNMEMPIITAAPVSQVSDGKLQIPSTAPPAPVGPADVPASHHGGAGAGTTAPGQPGNGQQPAGPSNAPGVNPADVPQASGAASSASPKGTNAPSGPQPADVPEGGDAPNPTGGMNPAGSPGATASQGAPGAPNPAGVPGATGTASRPAGVSPGAPASGTPNPAGGVNPAGSPGVTGAGNGGFNPAGVPGVTGSATAATVTPGSGVNPAGSDAANATGGGQAPAGVTPGPCDGPNATAAECLATPAGVCDGPNATAAECLATPAGVCDGPNATAAECLATPAGLCDGPNATAEECLAKATGVCDGPNSTAEACIAIASGADGADKTTLVRATSKISVSRTVLKFDTGYPTATGSGSDASESDAASAPASPPPTSSSSTFAPISVAIIASIVGAFLLM